MYLIILLLAAIVFIVIATTKLKLHPFLALLLAAFGFGIAAGIPLPEVVKNVNAGFGGTIGYIGIVILSGCIIGTFLEKSGGAYRLANAVLRLTGRKNVPLAMGCVGYVVSMPVFCDSAFVLLSSLMKALARRAGITIAACAIALSLGLYATHTMVPPTPGPVAAAGILGADLGIVILWGMLISFIAMITGWLFAILFARRIEIDDDAAVDPTPEVDKPENADAPNAGLSLLPILLPIILIVFSSIASLPSKPLGDSGPLLNLINFVGQPVVALLIGVFLAFLLPKKLSTSMLGTQGWIGEAVLSAATIIVITGAGGAFGKILQASGIAQVIGDTLANAHLGLWLPFIVAAGIKTAQGSSTVAIITTASLLHPLLPALGLDSETAKALVVVAIGAGSMVVSHANDSYFWVVTQFSGMDVKTGYKLQTLGTLIQGSVAATSIYIAGLIVL